MIVKIEACQLEASKYFIGIGTGKSGGVRSVSMFNVLPEKLSRAKALSVGAD